jgi:hypothetical protein
MADLSTPVFNSAETNLYERDFVLWLEQQAALLRQGRLDELDTENLAEEVDSIGRSDKREVRRRLAVLLTHLLKYQLQPGRRTQNWLSTIREQRRELQLVFEDSPSLLKSHLPNVFDDSYQYAKRKAGDETGLSPQAFPEACPYTLEQVLDEAFLPGNDGN